MRRASRFLSPVAGVAVGIALVGSTGVAVAATGGTFLLGRANAASTTTSLSNSAGTPLSLKAPAGKPPLAVSNSVKVPLLNSDKVDGLDSLQLQRRVAGTCPTGQAARAVTTLGSLSCTVLQVPVRNHVTVAAASTPAANGTALLAALAKITDGSATNPYVVRLGPGVFEVAQSISVPAHVLVVGAGRGATELRTSPACAGAVEVLALAAGSGLRGLSVLSDPSDSTCVARGVSIIGPGTRTLDDVAITVAGNDGTVPDISSGLFVEGGSVDAQDVSILMTDRPGESVGRGVLVSGDPSSVTVTLTRSKIVNLSELNEAIVAFSGLVRLSLSQVEGVIFSNGAQLQCVFNHDENLAPKNCP